MTRIIRREGAVPRVSRFFFRAVVHLVLIFGAETWVIAPRMGRVLGGVPVTGGATVEREAPAETD